MSTTNVTPLTVATQADVITVEFIRIIPEILWVLLGLAVFIFSYRLLRKFIIPKMTSFSAWGISISLLEKQMSAVIEIATKHPSWKVTVTNADKKQVIQRVRQHLSLLSGARILWFDDRPETLNNEIQMLRQLGIQVDNSQKLDVSLNLLEENTYDLLISDIARDNGQPNGIKAIETIRNAKHHLPVIFYIGNYDVEKGTPPYAFNITNRPDELLHLILDILERKKVGI